MSIVFVLGLVWLALAVFAWTLLAAAARGDRAKVQRPPAPRTRPRPAARARELV
jgi:hypothetical protein